MHENVELSGITKQIMPGPLGDLEEWQTLEVIVTLGFASGDIDLLGLPRIGDLLTFMEIAKFHIILVFNYLF